MEEKCKSKLELERKKKYMGCGVCKPCSQTEDCGECRFCKDKTKFGGPNKLRKKCKLRQCIEFSNSSIIKGIRCKKSLKTGKEKNDVKSLDQSSEYCVICVDESPISAEKIFTDTTKSCDENILRTNHDRWPTLQAFELHQKSSEYFHVKKMKKCLLNQMQVESKTSNLVLERSENVYISNLQKCQHFSENMDTQDILLNASLKLPENLRIGKSSISSFGYGIWSKTEIPKGIRFGPYEGVICYDPEESHNNGYYCWQMSNDKKTDFVADAKSPASNWMWYVNFASCKQQQNLIAFQDHGQIYYSSISVIPSHTELMVWYEEDPIELYSKEEFSDVHENNTFSKSVFTKDENCLKNHKYQICSDKDNQLTFLIKQEKQNGLLVCNTYHHGSLNNRCVMQTICEEKFHNDFLFGTHQPLHTEKNKLNVYSVKDEQIHTNEKQIHLDIHVEEEKEICAEERPYECIVCHMKFPTSSRLRVHRRSHKGEKVFACDVCNMRFFHQYLLKIHQRQHTGEKPYSCDVCQKAFSASSHLRTHKRNSYPCNIHIETVSSPPSLNSCQQVQTEDKPFSCNICKRRFTILTALKSHQRVHIKGKPHACNFCDRRYSTLATLMAHERFHTGGKPYTCDICQKTFSQSDHLKQHQQIHTEESDLLMFVDNNLQIVID